MSGAIKLLKQIMDLGHVARKSHLEVFGAPSAKVESKLDKLLAKDGFPSPVEKPVLDDGGARLPVPPASGDKIYWEFKNDLASGGFSLKDGQGLNATTLKNLMTSVDGSFTQARDVLRQTFPNADFQVLLKANHHGTEIPSLAIGFPTKDIKDCLITAGRSVIQITPQGGKLCSVASEIDTSLQRHWQSGIVRDMLEKDARGMENFAAPALNASKPALIR